MKNKSLIFIHLLLVLSCGLPKVNDSHPNTPKPLETPPQSSTSRVQTNIDRDKYIITLLGLSEDKLRQAFNNPLSDIPKKLVTRDAQGFFTLTNQKTDNKFKAGKFEFDKSVDALAQEASKLPMPGQGTFNIIDGSAFVGEVDEVDVIWLQAQPENKKAVFQVASNLNALEQISDTTSVDQQRLENYPSDPTQGPAASMSAAPGLIIRWGYAFCNSALPHAQWRQRNDHQVNFLKNLNIPVNNAGYVKWQKVPTKGPSAQDYKNILIGYHQDIQATFAPGKDKNSFMFFNDPEQVIDQVYGAAVALGYQHIDTANTLVLEWTKAVQNAIYEGTLKYAFVKNRKKVFLTRMGGGVFGNPPHIIDDAIYRNKDFIIDSGLEVILVNYAGKVSDKMLDLAEKTKGCYKQFDDNHQVIKKLYRCK